MARIHTSYMPTTGAKVIRKVDNLSFPFLARAQAMTFYLRFIEGGSISDGSDSRLLQISDNSSPALRFIILQNSSGAVYRAQVDNGAGGSVTSTLGAGPSVGDLVELRATISATGVVQLHQSINGAAETSATASAAVALPPKWTVNTLYVGSLNGTSNATLGLRNIVSVRGVLPLASMRRMAGVAR